MDDFRACGIEGFRMMSSVFDEFMKRYGFWTCTEWVFQELSFLKRCEPILRSFWFLVLRKMLQGMSVGKWKLLK